MFVILMVSLRPDAQIVDRAPTGTTNILPVEGGGIEMKIDSITPLNELIGRLNDDWKFIETGKGYWIGYTNDMFSIACRGDGAISALVHFFKTTTKRQGKVGALYTLHLIGIQRKIAGRFVERFVDTKARSALLGLLNEKDYVYTIVGLLMRNPWPSDIPRFFEILKEEKDDKVIWPIVNALNRYHIQGNPVNSLLPDILNHLEIKLTIEDEHTLEPGFDFNAQIKEALRVFHNRYPEIIGVEEKLYDEDLAPHYTIQLSSALSIRELLSSLNIEPGSPFNYNQIGCRVQYYLEGNKLYFCTIKTAQSRLNQWWAKLPENVKKKFK